MRIVQVCPLYYPYLGGVETHVKEISERLAMKFHVEVLSTDPSGILAKRETIGDVKVRRFKSLAPTQSYYFSKGLVQHLAKNIGGSDVLHAHSYRDLPALYCTQVRNVTKFIFTPHYHGGGATFFRNLLYRPYRIMGKRIFKKADHVVCVSRFEKNLVTNHFKVDEKKIQVIPNGIDLAEVAKFKKQKHDEKRILYVGRLEKYKGVHYIIEALPTLDQNTVLEVVGEGPYRNDLIKLVEKMGLQNRVVFHQRLQRKALMQKYVDADLFVLLSKHEAYGISVAEALASGTPCIVAGTSALQEWVDGRNCFGINYPIDVKELAKLAEEVVGKRVEGIHLPTWDDVTASLTKLYM